MRMSCWREICIFIIYKPRLVEISLKHCTRIDMNKWREMHGVIHRVFTESFDIAATIEQQQHRTALKEGQDNTTRPPKPRVRYEILNRINSRRGPKGQEEGDGAVEPTNVTGCSRSRRVDCWRLALLRRAFLLLGPADRKSVV